VIAPNGQARPDTNILITRFLSPCGVSEIQDFMPVGGGPRRLIRRMVGMRGNLRFPLEVEPRFDYSRHEPEVSIEPGRAVFRASGHSLALGSTIALDPTVGGVRAEFEVFAGDALTFVLRPGEDPSALSESEAEALRNETAAVWRTWLGQSSYEGRWREMVHRSALTLRLLSYKPSGALRAQQYLDIVVGTSV
jgi:GH15 family glucan-1,4-alpha-glucosidase